jgi:hypothetical protein
VGARAKENGATDIDCEWVRTLFDDACFENSKPLGLVINSEAKTYCFLECGLQEWLEILSLLSE